MSRPDEPVRLADLTSPEVAARASAGALLALPIGSTEQHGPHLPMSTDVDVADALCHALARGRSDVVVAPALGYGASDEHADFAGTLSIGTEVLTDVLVHIGQSAARTFDRLLVVSAHRGNADAVTRALDALRAKSHDVLTWSPCWPRYKHAGFVETSLQLALDGSRVRVRQVVAGPTADVADLMPAMRAGGVAAVSETGVLGDPGGASAPEGRRILAALAEDLLAAVEAWAGPVRTR